MEDTVQIKILELGEGEVVVIVRNVGGTTTLREGRVARADLPGNVVVGRRIITERPGAAPRPTFRREGQHWRVSFEGTVASLDDTVGVRHLAHLLAEPGRKLRCDELLAMLAGEPVAPCVRSAEYASDVRSLRAYRRRLDLLAKELAEAISEGDSERAVALRHEQEGLESHLRAVTGKVGRVRQVADGPERARQTVSAAIRRTMKVLKSAHPGLWRHLYKHLKTGYHCQYWPEPSVSWVTA